jgi:hypothetical protein
MEDENESNDIETQRRRPASPPIEIDARFPSGRWKGFWLQSALAGRQYMSLHLTFAAGKITGSGSDTIGNFTIAGSYDLTGGRCSFVKSYIGQHSVDYAGCNQNDGLWIWGTWTIRDFDRGGFHIWPHGEEDPTKKKLKSERDAPVEADDKPRDRVLVPAIGE